MLTWHRRIGWKFYLCFIFPALAMALYILFYAPDTNGVPLEEIAALFGVSSVPCAALLAIVIYSWYDHMLTIP